MPPYHGRVVSRGFRLGVDFGTSNTVAALRWPDGRVRPLLFDGSPLLPSAVFVEPDGRISVGQPAVHAARSHPERFEPHPKRCIDDAAVLFGPASAGGVPSAVPVPELIAAVLGRVAEEAARTAGAPIPSAVVTYPAAWGTARRNILLAAGSAVFPEVSLVPEPVAAASHFVAVRGGAVPVGASLMVYDLGAGTLDVSVVRRTVGGFEVLATGGLADVGGLDIDAAMVAYLGTIYAGRDAAAWARLSQPADPEAQRLSRILWDDVRAGKEILSRSTSVLVHVPIVNDDVPFGRELLEELAEPILARTVEVASAVLRDAGVRAVDLVGLYLVGGASRIPLVTTLLHRGLGIPPVTVEQPQLVVAEGSLHVGEPDRGRPGPAPVPQSPKPSPSPASAPAPASGQTGQTGSARPDIRVWRRRLAISGGLVLAVGAAVVALPLLRDPPDGRSAGDEGDGTGTVARSIDTCLIGTWQETHSVLEGRGEGPAVRRTGPGVVYRFWPTGRVMLDYGDSTTWTGEESGRGYEVVVSGWIEGTATTENGTLTLRDVRASGRLIGRVDGEVVNDASLPETDGSLDYRCSGDSLAIWNSAQMVTAKRVSDDPDTDA
ncbi:Hsp70 family protein [Micromonospora sp. HM5-17]|nr:Hsp70 family protein [Micromonospora sp. HM5-17]